MICIYHSRDLDGMCSGAIVKRKYPDAILIGYDYGEPFPMDKIPTGEHIIMIDVSLPMIEMEELVARSKKVEWVDHHIGAYRDYEKSSLYNSGKNFLCVFDNTMSACEGGWKYLFPDEPMPLAVQLLGEYDTFRKPDMERWNNSVMPFQLGMKAICNSPETFPMILLDGESSNGYIADQITNIISTGKTIIGYQEQMDTFMCKRTSFEVEFEGLRAICMNSQGGGSNAFKSVYDESKHDIMLPFQFNGRKWIFSIYTTRTDLDCSLIAKKYGGNGHAQACGFEVDDLKVVFKNIK